MKAELLRMIPRAALTPAALIETQKTSVRLGFACIAQDDYEPARLLADTAQQLAVLTKKTYLESEASFLLEECTRCSAGFDRVKKWAIRLAKSPDHPTANAACGRYLCFVKNAWAKGLPMLKKSQEPKLAELAALDLARPSLPLDQISLGDRWWDLANSAKPDERYHYRIRSKYWYAKALDGLVSTAQPFEETVASSKGRAEKRYAEFFKEFPPPKATLHISINVEGGAALFFDSDQISLHFNSDGVGNLSVNHQSRGRFSAGVTATFANYGATRFCSEALDFSKATILQRRINSRWGGAQTDLTIIAKKRRVELGFVDPPDGSADFDLVISF